MRFKPVKFTPVSIAGRSSSPKFRNREVNGVSLEITDHSTLLPVETGVAVVAGLYAAIPPEKRKVFFRKGFDDLAGSLQLRQATEAGETLEAITARWSDDVLDFTIMRRDYLLYAE